MKDKLIKQILKFLVVGGISTIIDWIIYYVLYNYLNVDPLIANVLSFSISVIFNYITSIKWVFVVDEKKNKYQLFTEFMIFSIIGLLISEVLLWLFIDNLGMGKMISKIIATAVTTVFNFITRKLFLEKK